MSLGSDESQLADEPRLQQTTLLYFFYLINLIYLIPQSAPMAHRWKYSALASCPPVLRNPRKNNLLSCSLNVTKWMVLSRGPLREDVKLNSVRRRNREA